MGNTPLVSVIIPCYKQAVFLPEALESLLLQTYPRWEAIVVNDGSPDDTEEVALKYAAKDSRIHYLSQNNQGVSAARNKGIEQAKGELILPLDADDWIKPTYIEKAVKVFQNQPETTLVYCLQCSEFEEKFPSPRYAGYKKLLMYNSIFCSAIFRKSDCLAIDGYDEKMTWGLEDWEFYIRLLNEQSIVHQIQEPLFFYRIKEESRNTIANLHIHELYLYIYKKHLDIYGKWYDDPISLLHNQDRCLHLQQVCNDQQAQIARLERYKQKYESEWFRRLHRCLKRNIRLLFKPSIVRP